MLLFYILFYCKADLFDVDMEEEVLLTVAVGVVNAEDSAKREKTLLFKKKAALKSVYVLLALFLYIALQIQAQRIHLNLSYLRPRFSLLRFWPSP